MEKLLPHNIEAEMGVLGSLIIDPEMIAQVADTLAAADFYRDAHATIYRAIMTLYERREAADFITLCDELARTGKLEDTGGASYLTSLINHVPTSGNAAYYAGIVARTAVWRRLIHAAGQIAALAYEEAPDALAQAEQVIYSIESRSAQSGFARVSELLPDFNAELEALRNRTTELVGVPSGYRDIDDCLGGFQKGDLILVAGRPSMGKTALALAMAYLSASRHGKSVALFSLEQSKRELIRRLVSMDAGLDQQRLRRGWIEDGEWEALISSLGRLSDTNIFLNDIAANPLLMMRAHLRRLIAESGKPDLVVVDYLQLVGDEEANKKQDEVTRITRISGGMKALAREFDVPVVVLCQLSREVERRQNKRPMLSDLRGSGALEQDADVVLFLYRDDYYAKQEGRASLAPGIAEVNIAKHRNGPVDEIGLYFVPERTMFYTLDERLTPEQIAAWERARKQQAGV